MDEKIKPAEEGQMVLNNVLQEKSYPVIKSNALIQNARFDLSSTEQKIITYAVQKVRPQEDRFYDVDISLTDFCNMCGISARSGAVRKNIKDTIERISNKKFWMEGIAKNGEPYQGYFGWIERAKIFPNLGIIQIRLNDDLADHLLQLTSFFTSYQFSNVATLVSKYSIRLYELCKSYENLGEFKISLDELKKALACDKYERWSEFRKAVFDKQITEINEKTDLFVQYTPIKKGKKIVSVSFQIRSEFLKKALLSDNLGGGK